MKAATIYERAGRTIVHSSSKTTAGVWVLTPPVVSMDPADEAGLGRAVRDCLEASFGELEHPRSFVGLFNPVLNLAGVRSYNVFAKSAKCVEVTFEGGLIKFVPTRNAGPVDGFVQLPNTYTANTDSDEKLGQIARAALAASI